MQSQTGDGRHPERIAVYPGTFDPVTVGHLDIARRALNLCDRLVMAVGDNRNKSPLFSVEERMSLITEALREMGVDGRVIVTSYSGLTVHFAQKVGASLILRGLRAVTDFEWEFQLALINRQQDASIETVCLMTSQEYSFLSASVVRELAMLGGKLEDVVPPNVAEALQTKYKRGLAAADVRDI
ncbi:MAG: pantetheine-phosphate adenylyltransferase [Chloroflexia bacterium]|jgi:pantetheine-phosphate adenylyltransferase|nr:pantetheine-phosphate adenylyltransferase [Chloroflexia bacterium]